MNNITIQQTWKDGIPMWDVEGEDFPGLAPTYARLETVLGLLEARARDWERFYVVTVIEPDVPVRVLTFDGDKMQKLLPMEWEKDAIMMHRGWPRCIGTPLLATSEINTI